VQPELHRASVIASAAAGSQAVAGRLRMNSTDLECLDHILRGPVTAGRLAQLTGLTTGAITGVIDRLERIGLARRESDPDDRRKTMVRALPAVLERVGPLFQPMERAAMAVLSKYSDDELALILNFLTSGSRCCFDSDVGASCPLRVAINNEAAQAQMKVGCRRPVADLSLPELALLPRSCVRRPRPGTA
jgi:DNA-binding MarR family transcriptional regulator